MSHPERPLQLSTLLASAILVAKVWHLLPVDKTLQTTWGSAILTPNQDRGRGFRTAKILQSSTSSSSSARIRPLRERLLRNAPCVGVWSYEDGVHCYSFILLVAPR